MCLPTMGTANLFDVIHFSVHVTALLFPNESWSFHVFIYHSNIFSDEVGVYLNIYAIICFLVLS